MLDNDVLDGFINSFYGYGNYKAKFWFVGMEEGGGNSIKDISRRLEAWKIRGRKELEDIAEYSRAIGVNKWFEDKPKLQRTWNKLIHIVLAANGQPCNTECIRNYQKRTLGTLDGDTCLLELLPLPSPNINSWLYSDNSSLRSLTDRKTYEKDSIPFRIPHLQNRLSQYRPTVVVFYGLTYKDHWKEIAGVQTWIEESPEKIMHAKKNHTLFIMAKHPVAIGVTNEYFNQIGRLVAAKV